MRNVEYALDYAARGWPVAPLHEVANGQCSCANPDCGSKGKHPRTKSGIKDATTEAHTIEQWWAKWPEAPIALACGEASGVFVLDVDTKDGKRGAASLSTLQDNVGDLPETLEAKTGSGGRHLFYVYPSDRPVRNKQPIDKDVYPDLDVRGEGGYVVLPPSIHETGKAYAWANGLEPEDCTTEALDVIAPKKSVAPPWAGPKEAPQRAPERPGGTPVLERAARYLEECEPAQQGAGGHNALLWAARSMVIGFELSDSDAINLLWSVFNPRCAPPWDYSSSSDRKDFERKVTEARNTPGEKPRGWALEEYNLRSDKDALASMIGEDFASTYKSRVITSAATITDEELAKEEEEIAAASSEFPLHCLPPKVREFVELVADVQVVDPAGVALSVLTAAGASMGNAFSLRLKGGFDVPPILWGAIISRSSSNKSGPFRVIVKPLRAAVPIEQLDNRMLNPQGQFLVEDATTESIIDVMSSSQRGLIMANGEGAGWVGAFDRYSQGSKKNSSVDETIWLKMWDGDPYQKNRKTEQENILIHKAACSVLVCIQPKKMAECFDPSQFASGLVPRLLVVYLPKRYRGWSERELNEDDMKWWHDVIMFLRGQPFEAMDACTGEFSPNVILPSVTAKARYVEEFNRVAQRIDGADEMSELFLGKSQGVAARLALVLHGIEAACGLHGIKDELSEQTMLNAIELMRYFVDEQLTVYNLAGVEYTRQRMQEVMAIVRNKGGECSARDLQRANNRKWATAELAIRDLKDLAKSGAGTWDSVKRKFIAND